MTSLGQSRRRFLVRGGSVLGALAAAHTLPYPFLRRLGGGLLLPEARADTGTECLRLDTNDPYANFIQAGSQAVSPGPNTLIFDDQSGSDVSALIGFHPCAASGTQVDVVSTFQIVTFTPSNAWADFVLIINDGVSKAAVLACVILNGVRGLGLAGPGLLQDASTYQAFFPIDWQQAPVTVRLRRTAEGGAELVEVNGIAPDPRVFLGPEQVPGRTRTSSSFDFGCFSAEGLANVAVTEFYAEEFSTVVVPATPDVHPKTISRKSQGPYVTAYVEFPDPALDPGDIDVGTVTLQAVSPVTSVKLTVASGAPTAVGDGNGNGIIDRMVKFDLATVQSWFPEAGNATLRLEGKFLDGRTFQGDDASVRIVN